MREACQNIIRKQYSPLQKKDLKVGGKCTSEVFAAPTLKSLIGALNTTMRSFSSRWELTVHGLSRR